MKAPKYIIIKIYFIFNNFSQKKKKKRFCFGGVINNKIYETNIKSFSDNVKFKWK